VDGLVARGGLKSITFKRHSINDGVIGDAFVELNIFIAQLTQNDNITEMGFLNDIFSLVLYRVADPHSFHSDPYLDPAF
jgi:hypothetical protein